MDRHRTSPVITSPAEMRAAARSGEWRGSTGGQCPAYQQANLVILPKEVAVEFAANHRSPSQDYRRSEGFAQRS